MRRAFLRPAECAGKLPHADGCGVFVAFVQATQYISEFGWEGLVAGRGVGLLSTLWDGLCFGLGRRFEMRSELWDEGFTQLKRGLMADR